MIPINELVIPAARKGDVAVLRELIRQNADLNVREEKGYTPLIIACYNNHYATAELLLQNGADVNAQDTGGNTALMGIAFKGYADIAKLLIENKADLNIQHGNGGSALMFAAMFGQQRSVAAAFGIWRRYNPRGRSGFHRC